MALKEAISRNHAWSLLQNFTFEVALTESLSRTRSSSQELHFQSRRRNFT